MNIPKKDLERIKNWLVGEKIDERSLSWLKQKRVGLFEGGKIPKDAEEAKKMLLNPNDYGLSLVNSSKENISFTIQDILSAIAENNRFGYTPRGNLSKKLLLELASIMNIKNPERLKRINLLNEILDRLPKKY
jgi:hypothetical protein